MTETKFDASVRHKSGLEPMAHVQDILLTEAEVARRQSRSIKTLQNQRVSGGGIPFLKLGRSVRYRLSDVIAWEEAGRCYSTSSGGRSNG